MVRLLVLFVILTSVGCQTVPTQEKKETTSKKEVVTVLVELFDSYGHKITIFNSERRGDKVPKFNLDGTIVQGQDESSLFEYKITVKWSEFKPDGTEDVLTSPMMTGKPNKWSTLRIGKPHGNLKSTVSYLIDDEKISLQTVNGVNLISKIIPGEGQVVQAQGIVAISKVGLSGELLTASVPFNVFCNLNEPKSIYENEIKSESVK